MKHKIAIFAAIFFGITQLHCMNNDFENNMLKLKQERIIETWNHVRKTSVEIIDKEIDDKILKKITLEKRIKFFKGKDDDGVTRIYFSDHDLNWIQQKYSD